MFLADAFHLLTNTNFQTGSYDCLQLKKQVLAPHARHFLKILLFITVCKFNRKQIDLLFG